MNSRYCLLSNDIDATQHAEALLINKEAEIYELRNQLMQGESQFQLAVKENQEVFEKLEAESKKKIQKKLPVFAEKTITFNRLINGVTEIFENYPTLKDFQKRALVVESLKGPVRDWYDAEPDSNVANWDNFNDSLKRQYGSLESTDQALERIDALRLTLKSDSNSFIQQIRPSIKLIAGNNNILAIAMLRKQVDPEIRKYVPKATNESFEEHEKRLKAHMSDSQAKFTSYSSRSSNMDVDPITASIQADNNYAIVAAQYVPYNRQRQLGSNYQRNQFQSSTKPVTSTDPIVTNITTTDGFEHPATLFLPRLPNRDLALNKINDTPLTTMTLHMHESICFRLSATINDCQVSVLSDTGSQITLMTKTDTNSLNLYVPDYKPIKLQLGDNSDWLASAKLTFADICFGKTTFPTTFSLMDSQPYDIILGANFIVASKATYDPVTMIIRFTHNSNADTFKMMSSGLKASEWAPLVLAASAIDCIPKADPDISAILRDVATLFDPTPSIINTDFPHQLLLTTDQPVHARMRRYSPKEARVLREHVKKLNQIGYV
ncbi:hypothetical protein BB560_006052 [Smittium megazygosporum]|uniref:Uncharacterized protein n=1 Tax=Smittium megazygosporum TaxID=133381 RepID=A0A2T9YJQ2_9FUNG|nr:hypothetical protein BB560_006052 [Smittium megazygosporum]